MPTINPDVVRHFLRHRLKEHREYYLHPPYLIETRLLKAVSEGKYDSAYFLLKKINRLERAMLAEDPVRSLKNSLICSCTLLTRAVIGGGMPPETAFNYSDACILEIEKMSDRDALLAFEYTMLEGFIDQLKKVQKKLHSYSHPVQIAVEFIHERILQDFTLQDIAGYVYLNPNYLSHIFKKEVGWSLTEFINRERIEESLYFLAHTNSSVSEIALLFHFCNQSYYTSLFKKYCGMTPSEYRQRKDKDEKTEARPRALVPTR
ncbi:helix-turn-helix transcriptional regulator [Sporolactobacillus vineae]|uniref:helix-turn-helix transcriptional regulator n=1 Tax=Sporolactobacillus vineae TaxID=444463 RepID=UPI00028817EB|nr:AraC family transcriptional regulator [Sporolactobacillus vineae]